MSEILKGFVRAVSLAVLLFASFACSDEDKRGEASEDYEVVVEMCYMPAGNASAVVGAEISWPTSEDEGASDIVHGDKSWTRQITYKNCPEHSVGFNITPLLDEKIAEGSEVNIKYSIKCAVTLMSGGMIVDFVALEDDFDYDITYSDVESFDLSEKYLFMVTKDRIERLIISKEEESTEVAEEPDNDSDAVKANGTLYYFSCADDEEKDNHLFDNFIARFGDRRLWDGVELGKGDFLFLHKNDIEKANLNVLKASLSNGVVIVVDALESYSIFKAFCEFCGIYNPLPDDEIDVSHTMFIIANADSNITSEGVMPYRGVFFMLSPESGAGKPETVSDYWQGVIIDQAIMKLNEIRTESNEGVPRSDWNDDMQKLVGAYKVFLSDGGYRHTLYKSDYQKGKVAKDSQTNIYNVEYDIWNVFSLTEKRNYYYIHQEFLGSFSACFKDVYNAKVKSGIGKSIAKVCEWYGDNVTLTTTPYNSEGMQIHRNSLETTSSSTSYQSGFSWNLGGEIGFLGKTPSGNVNSGISLNSSYSYTIEDVTISNSCVPGSVLEWCFDLKNARCKFNPIKTAATAMEEGALAGRKSFTAGTDFIISFPESTVNPLLKGELRVELRRTCGKMGLECHEATDILSEDWIIKLPSLKSSQFSE